MTSLPVTSGFEKYTRPICKGQWTPVQKDFSKGIYQRGDLFTAEHPVLGTIYLYVESATNYTTYKNTRIRDVGRTSNLWTAEISTTPWDTSGTRVFTIRCSGEGKKVYDKRDSVRARLLRQFGVDPWSYLGPLPEKA